MAQFPTVETLTSIAGIGGWAGAYHALNVYFEDGPIMADRAIKMAALPVIWSMSGVLGLVLGSSVIKTVGFVYGAMFQPVPFVVNTLIISAIFLVLTTLNHIRVVFKTTVENAVQEMAADAAEAMAASNDDEETEEDEAETETEAEAGEQDAESDTESEADETSEEDSVASETASQNDSGEAEQSEDTVVDAPPVEEESQPLPDSPITPSAVSVTPPRPSSPSSLAEPTVLPMEVEDVGV
jgi:hypothetical protein